MVSQHKHINLRGNLVVMDTPWVMGVLNVTTDSFFDGGRYIQQDEARAQAAKMVQEGARVLDIGGMSSRPGADLLPVDEEIRRVLPIVEFAINQLDCLVSVDTFRSEVARAVLDAGAHIINDITAGSADKDMFSICAKYDAPMILMHMQGSPRTMQDDPQYEDVVREVVIFLKQQLMKARSAGVRDVILDPGFGFGKTVEHNYRLLSNLHVLRMFDCPVLAGLSRKSMIYRTLETSQENALAGSIAASIIALQQGASILRVHDVKQTVDAMRIYQKCFGTMTDMP